MVSYTLHVEEYEARSFVKSLGTGSVDLNVADIDLTNVSLTVSPTR